MAASKFRMDAAWMIAGWFQDIVLNNLITEQHKGCLVIGFWWAIALYPMLWQYRRLKE